MEVEGMESAECTSGVLTITMTNFPKHTNFVPIIYIFLKILSEFRDRPVFKDLAKICKRLQGNLIKIWQMLEN